MTAQTPWTPAATRADAAVVTGIGIMAPNGTDLETYWKAALTGTCAIAPVPGLDAERYPVRLAGTIDVDPAERLPSPLLTQTDRVTRLALLAAEDALADAGADPAALPEFGMGVSTANASGGFGFTHREINKLWTRGPEHVSVYESFAWFYAVNTGQISIRHRMRGASTVLVADQAGGLDAIGHARRTLRRGGEFMVTGGMDSSFDPWGWVSHLQGAGASAETDPETAYRPFDAGAAGAVPGEGGAILIVERADAALARGVSAPYGEIAGYAAGFDPAPGSGRPPVLRRVAADALRDAGITPAEVDVVFADAAAVPGLDRAEAEALAGLFGPRGVPVTAPKAAIGRLSSGGPAVDVATALLALRDNVIPPTPKTADVPEDYRIDLVLGAPREAELRTALVLARGRGGFTSALVLRRTGPWPEHG